jgi:hypothetical protein
MIRLIETEGITRVTRDYELFPGIDILGAPEHRDEFISSLVCTINFVRTPVIDSANMARLEVVENRGVVAGSPSKSSLCA